MVFTQPEREAEAALPIINGELNHIAVIREQGIKDKTP
jgi:hypothetical protein